MQLENRMHPGRPEMRRFQRRYYFGGIVREIIYHLNAACLADKLKPPGHALIERQALCGIA